MSVPDRSDKKAFAEYVASVMKGWAEGHPVEFRPILERGGWDAAAELPEWNWTKRDYRLAPEAPKVEPWTFETCPAPVFKARRKCDGKLIVVFAYPEMFEAHESIYGSYYDALDGAQLAANYDMPDGTPCGIVQPSAGQWPKWFRCNDWPLVMLCRYDSEHESTDLDFSGHPISAEKWTLKEMMRKVRSGYVQQITAAEAEALIQKARAGK